MRALGILALTLGVGLLRVEATKKCMGIDPFGDQLTGVMVIAGDRIRRTELSKRGKR